MIKIIKNIVNLTSFVALISFLAISNRFIYNYIKEEDLSFCFNNGCPIYKEETLFLIGLIICLIIFTASFFIYNPTSKALPSPTSIEDYIIEKKEHSTMLWGVICYPLILCPMPASLLNFFLTLILILIFTTLYLKHLNEIILPPVVILNGQKLYFLKHKDNGDAFYILTDKSKEDLEKSMNINKRELLGNIYKDVN